MTSAVSFQKVSRHFGSVRAVDMVDLDIVPGEFFAMLGPSGSGKTTCLRLIAGFEQPTSGSISIFGERAEGVPPYRRNVNTVFQDYALFPHLNVLENVAYGLMVKGVGKPERQKAAEEALSLVRLPGYGARRPSQLSGGQRQRVALARVLVRDRPVLLLDEPFASLGPALRDDMLDLVADLQAERRMTVLFVTHQPEDAHRIGQDMVFLDNGTVAATGTVADFFTKAGPEAFRRYIGAGPFGVGSRDVARKALPWRWQAARCSRLRTFRNPASSLPANRSPSTMLPPTARSPKWPRRSIRASSRPMAANIPIPSSSAWSPKSSAA
ncbi:MAG: ABC transporter ATP-binding protein [Mesorhizobium sp.]|nr:MAG: ABC transporter ATP-binding protein [Mesorhizobium sp.]